MSVDYYLVCHDCKSKIHVADDGLSGFSFYSGEPETVAELKKFFAHHAFHQNHRLGLVDEHHDCIEHYSECGEKDEV